MTMTTEKLVQELRRPMHNYTRAMHGDSYFPVGSQQRKAAATRRKNALAEIHQLALEYVKSGGAPEGAFKR